jgi:NodT family efflux transporter outer membrane factor (OMF) lipoprotein
VNVAFVPDIWGANVRAVESLDAQAEQQKYQYLAASLALTSNVVNAAIGEASLRAQIAATRKIIAIETEFLDLLRRQQAIGQIADADVQLQVVTLAQSQQLLPPLEKQLAQQRDLMTALTGELTSTEVTEKFELHSLRLPRTLPVSVPSTMLARRPDVRAAEAMIHQASADLGVAIANRLPNIVLSANAGSSAFKAAELFTPGPGFYTLAASATQPIFTGGPLAAKPK